MTQGQANNIDQAIDQSVEQSLNRSLDQSRIGSCLPARRFNGLDPRRGSLIRGLHNLQAEHRGCVLTIGAFDGVHLGHQAILQQVINAARQRNLPSVAMVFEPQPNEYFARDNAPARLMRLSEKLQALFAAGIDRVLCLRFDAKLASLTADEFIERILIDGLGVKHLVVGDDFRFGCDRRGDFSLLQQWGTRGDFSVDDTATFNICAGRASSTRIRQALASDDFALAEQLLGHEYRISGRVIYGKQLGRTLGVPTANVQLKRYRSPLKGVFAVNVLLAGGDTVQGVANIGVRPTVGGTILPLLEVHLFDFDRSIYGERIDVVFCEKLRDEKTFANLESLKNQIKQDIDDAKVYFKQRQP